MELIFIWLSFAVMLLFIIAFIGLGTMLVHDKPDNLWEALVIVALMLACIFGYTNMLQTHDYLVVKYKESTVQQAD